MDGTWLGTHPEPETKQQGPGTDFAVKEASGSEGQGEGSGELGLYGGEKTGTELIILPGGHFVGKSDGEVVQL